MTTTTTATTMMTMTTTTTTTTMMVIGYVILWCYVHDNGDRTRHRWRCSPVDESEPGSWSVRAASLMSADDVSCARQSPVSLLFQISVHSKIKAAALSAALSDLLLLMSS